MISSANWGTFASSIIKLLEFTIVQIKVPKHPVREHSNCKHFGRKRPGRAIEGKSPKYMKGILTKSKFESPQAN
jgi:hypothetical protein